MAGIECGPTTNKCNQPVNCFCPIAGSTCLNGTCVSTCVTGTGNITTAAAAPPICPL